MTQRQTNRLAACGRWLAAVRARTAELLGRAWRAVRHRCRPAPVEVLVTDRTARRALERELRSGLRRLQRALGAPLPADLAIVVQQVITTERQLAGCYQLGKRWDGTQFALVRLALQVNGRRLSTDELLAALAEQCVGLATQGSPSVLVPIDFERGQPPGARRLTALRPDPLAPHPNGALRGERVA
jgi:hypothetical protein